MKEILLAYGRDVVLVDDEDYEELNSYSWYLQDNLVNRYARRRLRKEEREEGSPRQVFMHRQIMEIITDSSTQVDHRDGNGLNNQRTNLRLATSTGNNRNVRKREGTSSQYKGVHWDVVNGKWLAGIVFKRKLYNLGRFKTEEEAALVYNNKARELFGEFACLNTILKKEET